MSWTKELEQRNHFVSGVVKLSNPDHARDEYKDRYDKTG
jgi:hypothetical protein